MDKKTKPTIIILKMAIVIVLVVLSSHLSTYLWSEKKENVSRQENLVVREDMTVEDFGRENNLANPALKKMFSLQTKEDLRRKISAFSLSMEELKNAAEKASVLESEYESKNWLKIPLKFVLWVLFLAAAFISVRKSLMKPSARKWFYGAAVVLFGVVLGSDPSPMGTVKDAIVLFGSKKVVFPPRMIAMSVFLLFVFYANKFICAWGCQMGTLQDFIFRINRNEKETAGIIAQYKPPFVLTNTVRIAVFAVLCAASLMWSVDIFEGIDPFKVFKPTAIGMAGGMFILGILIASLFTYRPWCLFFCPFGLVGWIIEKFSVYKISVDYETCIACESCVKACPSTVMTAILKREKKVIPDCFACATCIGVCPVQAISFKRGKRMAPPRSKFGLGQTNSSKK